MHIDLRYGKGNYRLELDPGWDVTVIRKPEMPLLADAAAAVRAALAQPVGARPLAEEARGANSACILVCDITRPVPNGLFLPLLIRELLDAGVPARRHHRPGRDRPAPRPTRAHELAELVGDPWVLRTVRVENHFARNDADHVDLGHDRARHAGEARPALRRGRAARSPPAWSSRTSWPATRAAARSSPRRRAHGHHHHLPQRALHGASARRQLRARGQSAARGAARDRAHAGRRAGAQHRDRRAARPVLRQLRRGGREPSAGGGVHPRATREVPIAARFGTVVTSAAGYPLDKTYYQTVKGMVGADRHPGARRRPADRRLRVLGGHGLDASTSRRSAGWSDLGADGFLAEHQRQALRRHRRVADADAAQADARRRACISTATAWRAEAWRLTGVHRMDSVPEAIRDSVRRSGDAHIAVIPEGPYVVPEFRPAA